MIETTSPVIEAVAASMRYGGRRPAKGARAVTALSDLSFRIHEGERLGLIGANGAGKSTLLRLVSGILRPSGGKVLLFGKDPARRSDRALRQIGYVMGARSRLVWDLPARDSFLLHKAVYGVGDKDYASAIAEYSEIFNLGDLLDKPVRKMSLGQRMKVDIALALMHRPSLLLLDEPTISLDPATRNRLRAALVHASRRNGTTLVLASNDLEDVRTTCDRILVLADTRIVFDGTLTALYECTNYHRHLVVELSMERSRDDVIARMAGIGLRPSARSGDATTIQFIVPPGRDEGTILALLLSLVGGSVRKYTWGAPTLDEVVHGLVGA